jgi:hypothetical protein
MELRMVREIVTVNRMQFITSPDARPPVASSLCAIAEGQVVDEQTQAETYSPICGTTTLTRACYTGLCDGFFAVAGVPLAAVPGLAVQSYSFSITFSADGYIPQTVSTSIGPIPGFPDTFDPVLLPMVSLHRSPASIFGRVVRRVSGATTPIASASVQVTTLWRILPQAGSSPLGEPPNILSVQPPLGLARTAGVDTLQQQSWTPTAGVSKVVLQQSPAGTTQILLQDAVGLSVGSLLLIDGDDPATAEVVTLAAVPISSLANQPATVSAAAPLILTHNDGAIAELVTVAPAGPANTFTQNALPGDVVVFLSGLTGLSPTDTAEIPGASAEFHTVSQFNITADANGYYRLPPISRVYQVAITASDGLGNTLSQTIWPDYLQQDNNQYDFVFH